MVQLLKPIILTNDINLFGVKLT
jgi:hypothetical protein